MGRNNRLLAFGRPSGSGLCPVPFCLADRTGSPSPWTNEANEALRGQRPILRVARRKFGSRLSNCSEDAFNRCRCSRESRSSVSLERSDRRQRSDRSPARQVSDNVAGPRLATGRQSSCGRPSFARQTLRAAYCAAASSFLDRNRWVTPQSLESIAVLSGRNRSRPVEVVGS